MIGVVAEVAYGNAAWTVCDPRVEPCPMTGCWIWIGAMSAKTGYGSTSVNGKSVMVHRVFFARSNGEIPDGRFIDHQCKNRLCVNPDHLRAVTPRQSSLENCDSPSAMNAKKVACGKCGGSFHTTPSGDRVCKPCRAASTAKRMLNQTIRDMKNARARASRARAADREARVIITRGIYALGVARKWPERSATRMIQRAMNRVARTGQSTTVYPLPPRRLRRSVHRMYRHHREGR